ncbi:MAG TPA: LptF/LptG family permease [Candidatus Angelobacter sp.]|nr:LptF/LptG family permease [Candidatus Angelobacter sp.]
MRLLDRYLLRELLVPLGYCLGGFLVFWIAFDLFSELGAFQQDKLKPLEIAEYYIVITPRLLQEIVMPAALLLALLYALTNHARHHELTAMRAAGVSLWRLCVPYLVVGICCSAFLFLLNEEWLPDSAERADRIRKQHTAVPAGSRDQQWQPDLKFRNDGDDRFWRIRAYNVETGEMIEPYVEWRLPDGSRRQMLAERGIRSNGVWTFFNVRESVPDPSPDSPKVWEQTNVLAVAEFSETPEQIKSEIKISQLSSIKAAKRPQLSIEEILDYKRLHPRLRPADRALLDTQLHARLAAPWTCLIVVLIAIPFGAPSGRRNVFAGVAASIFICFTYFILQRFSLALGTGGKLPAEIAAWLPNALFAGAGIWLTARVR